MHTTKIPPSSQGSPTINDEKRPDIPRGIKSKLIRDDDATLRIIPREKQESIFVVAKTPKHKARSMRDDMRWVAKHVVLALGKNISMEILARSMAEVVSGEFHRLLRPSLQPKVRFMDYQGASGHHYIGTICRVVADYQALPDIFRPRKKVSEATNIFTPQILGDLGLIMPLHLWLGNNDAGWANHCLSQGHLIALDNEFSFSQTIGSYRENCRYDQKKFDVSNVSIKFLADSEHYKPRNLLHTRLLDSSSFDSSQELNPVYQKIKLATLHKNKDYLTNALFASLFILLLSDDAIKTFIDIYAQPLFSFSDDCSDRDLKKNVQQIASNMTAEAINRRAQYQRAMLKDELFTQYLRTDYARFSLLAVENLMRKFVPYGKTPLWGEGVSREKIFNQSIYQLLPAEDKTDPVKLSMHSQEVSKRVFQEYRSVDKSVVLCQDPNLRGAGYIQQDALTVFSPEAFFNLPNDDYRLAALILFEKLLINEFKTDGEFLKNACALKGGLVKREGWIVSVFDLCIGDSVGYAAKRQYNQNPLARTESDKESSDDIMNVISLGPVHQLEIFDKDKVGTEYERILCERLLNGIGPYCDEESTALNEGYVPLGVRPNGNVGSYGMSRTIGNFPLIPWGVTSTPTLTKTVININPVDQAIFIYGSDGLVEWVNDIKPIISEQLLKHGSHLQKAVDEICTVVRNRGSKDDMSMIVADIRQGVLAFFVTDGNGEDGDYVAERVSVLIEPTLSAAVDEVKAWDEEKVSENILHNQLANHEFTTIMREKRLHAGNVNTIFYEQKWSLVCYAVYANVVNFLEHLIKLKTNLDIGVAGSKKTALHCAAELGRLDMVKVLVAAGADCNAEFCADEDNVPETPYDVALNKVGEDPAYQAVVDYLVLHTQFELEEQEAKQDNNISTAATPVPTPSSLLSHSIFQHPNMPVVPLSAQEDNLAMESHFNNGVTTLPGININQKI